MTQTGPHWLINNFGTGIANKGNNVSPLDDCSSSASSGERGRLKMQAKPNLKLVPPTGENRAVAPGRRPNTEYSKREHLTPAEVGKLIQAAKANRYGQRDPP